MDSLKEFQISLNIIPKLIPQVNKYILFKNYDYLILYYYVLIENEAAEIDKKTVLDLCAHMFHPKDTSLDHSTTLELNELKTKDRIREYENE